jgi:hypothetical protein
MVIDPNYLASLALRKIVSDDYIVHSIEKAVNKLRHDIGPCGSPCTNRSEDCGSEASSRPASAAAVRFGIVLHKAGRNCSTVSPAFEISTRNVPLATSG